MRTLLVAFALLSLPVSALAAHPVIFEATSADKASGFRSMAECESALGRSVTYRGRAVRGSMFNRAKGNISRCELIAGELMIVVYPAAQSSRATR